METVDMSELIRCARIPLEPNIEPGEEVLILADTTTDEAIPKAMAAALREIGAEPVVVVMETRPVPNQPPPKAAAAAMKATDVLLFLGTHAIMHTDAMRAALAAGIKYITMVGITVDNMTRGAATVDPRELYETTERVASMLTEASTARVLSDLGTDVTMGLQGRKAFIMGGLHVPGKALAGFPHGEAAIAPVEGSAEGTIVIDTTLEPAGRLSQPVTLRVQRGRITQIEGGREAEQLSSALSGKGDENCYMIGEFAIGTNSKARITGIMGEDKRALGSVHFGFGDNRSLNGTVRAPIHLDGLILRPTVILDGKTVVEKGGLRL